MVISCSVICSSCSCASLPTASACNIRNSSGWCSGIRIGKGIAPQWSGDEVLLVKKFAKQGVELMYESTAVLLKRKNMTQF